MDKLIEIAMEHGSRIHYPDGSKPDRYFFKADELRDYTEQVCRPLVEALENYRESEMHGLGAVFNTPAKEALAAYTEIMGDKK